MVSANNQTKLHYVFDPLCGWCYAAAPLIHAAAQLQGLAVVLHPGGMMSGANRQTVSPALRNYVMPHDQRIAELTGQPFGDAYFNGLLLDTNAVFDSTPPTLAILAAQALGFDGLAMLGKIQHAHYAQGLRISDGTVLQQLASELGMDSASFLAQLDVQAQQIEQRFAITRKLMQQHGLRGFPSLLLEHDGQLQHIDISPFLGQADAFVQSLQAHGITAQTGGTDALCTLQGCGI
ncbi:DsbA family protein [Chitinibacter sp. GC72]|uniref:DsbA family protein n=1 Tax=Chitinibacter sp. GC72 TaxID=1526917 RepID=UPI0012F7F4AF|nr:DsbA family protein [Chitinibacter sp. GC72]